MNGSRPLMVAYLREHLAILPTLPAAIQVTERESIERHAERLGIDLDDLGPARAA